MKTSSILLAAMALTSCNKPVPKPAASVDASGAIPLPEWVQVSENTDGKAVFVNKSSIFPYKQMKRAELAYFDDKDKYKGVVMAVDCSTRMQSMLGLDGSVTPEAPVVTWTVYTHVYNFICFDKVDAAYVDKPKQANLNIVMD